MREKFLKITNAAYKVLDFFPESDPLKNRAKDKTLAIMENLTLISGTNGWASLQKEKAKTQIAEDIDVLLGYFWIGKSQEWLSAINCFIISNEYEKIKKEIKPNLELTQKLPGMDKPLIKESPPSPDAFSFAKELQTDKPEGQGAQKAEEPVLLKDAGVKEELTLKNLLTDRKKKILDFLSQNEKAQVMDLQRVLPDVTKRTIRRDLDELLQEGKIVRLGEFNQVIYKIKQ